MALTLVPEPLAEPGYTFTFLGPNKGAECQDCPVQNLCFRLEPGRRYRVTAVRGVTHPCNLHDEDRVRVCEVEEVPLATSIRSSALRGTAVTWNPVDCGHPACPQWAFCHPAGATGGARYAVAGEDGAMDCPKGFAITAVRLRRV